jgi:hypothetical protein
LLAAALTSGLVCQQFTVFIMPTALLLFVTVGLGVASSDKGADPKRASLILRVAAALIAAILLFVAVRLVVADYALARTRQYLDAGRIRQAAVSFAQYDRWRLPGTAADLWYSRACLQAAQTVQDPAERVQALAQYGFAALRATGTAEDPFNAWYNVSQLYAVRNDAGGVERSLRSAIAARPNWFKPHWILAQLLSMENRLDQARSEADLAARLDGGAHPEVTATREEIEHKSTPGVPQSLHK